MKTLFITGAGEGIGRKCLEKYLSEGFCAGVLELDPAACRQLASDFPDHVSCYCGDTSCKEDVKAAVEQTLSRFGTITTVVANAGIHRGNTILSISDEELERMLAVNVKGYVYTIQQTLPILIENGGGAIVLNASDQSFIGKTNSFGYGLTKGAVGQMIKSVALDYGKYNIRINGVSAGTIDTPLAQTALRRWADADMNGDYAEAVRRESALFPLGRLGRAEEVAEFVYFLSEKATFTTGSLHLVDGGLVAG